jgi:hypothetical protein
MAAAEEEAVVAVQDVEAFTFGQEQEGGVDERVVFPRDIGEVMRPLGDNSASCVEKAGKGLGHLAVTVRVGDEVAPARADALAAADGPGGHARDDVGEDVVGDLGRGVDPCLHTLLSLFPGSARHRHPYQEEEETASDLGFGS